jgi:ABC-2 type transport system permease protein
MRADFARLDLWTRRRSLAGYASGLAVYVLVVVAMYPAFKNSTSLDTLIKNDSTAAALFGISGSISTTEGWLNANIYANFFPLLMLLLTIGYGAGCLAGQDEEGSLGLIAALPVSRTKLVAEKAAAMVVQALALTLAVAACVLVGRHFELNVTAGSAFSVSVAVGLLGLDFGLGAMAVGALSGRRGAAIGASAAVAAASYLVSSLAPVVSWLKPIRYLSLFYWAVGNNQVTGGVSPLDYLVLVGVALAATVAATAAFRHLDLH